MSDTGHEFPSDHVLRRPIRHRRPLRRDLQRAHAHASSDLGGIDTELEALLERRRACLDELDLLRTALNRRWTHHHVRRPARVDQAPLPPAPPGARPLVGIDLRSVCLTVLRRHGPQDLRALHGLLHCYGYVVGGVRPVQRLGDAMAYELRCGRTVRVSRGVYAAVSDDDPPRPSWHGPSPRPASPLPWNRPVTDPAPPLVDPPVAHDPEHWSGGQWPAADDEPADPGAIDDAAAGAAHPGESPQVDASAATPTPPPRPRLRARAKARATGVGDDSSTNRPRVGEAGSGAAGAGVRPADGSGGEGGGELGGAGCGGRASDGGRVRWLGRRARRRGRQWAPGARTRRTGTRRRRRDGGSGVDGAGTG